METRIRTVAKAQRGHASIDDIINAISGEGAPAGPFVALDIAEVALWRVAPTSLEPLLGTIAASISLAGHYGSLMPEPIELSPLRCGPRRNMAQTQAHTALRRGTLALTAGRCNAAEGHFVEGLSRLNLAGPSADPHAGLSVRALLLNNWSEQALHCDQPWQRAASLRREAIMEAQRAGAAETIDLASAGLAFLYAEAPPGTEIDFQVAIGAARAARNLAEKWAMAPNVAAREALGGLAAKALALDALYLATTSGAAVYGQVQDKLLAANALAEQSGASFAELSVFHWGAIALAQLGHVAAATEATRDMLAATLTLWTRFSEARAQRGLFANVERWLGDALEFAFQNEDWPLAFEIMERSKDLALLIRLVPGPKSSQPAPAPLSDLQAALAPDEAAIHLDRIGSDGPLVGLVITSANVEQMLPVAPRTVALALAWSEALARGHAPSTAQQAAAATLMASWSEQLSPSVNHLWLSARGELHGFAFAAAPLGEGIAIDRFTITLAPSFSTALAVRRSHLSRPLTGAHMVLVDASRFDPQKEVTRHATRGGDAASLAISWRAAIATKQPLDLLAVKAHGFVEERTEQAWQAWIQLTPTGEDDGRVTPFDISSAKLQARLVLLSSCHAARGESTPGDQLDTFARSFLAAGALSVLAPTVAVPTGSADRLVETALEQLAQGHDARHALREGQRRLRKDDNRSGENSSFAWAFFCLTGDGAVRLAGRPDPR